MSDSALATASIDEEKINTKALQILRVLAGAHRGTMGIDELRKTVGPGSFDQAMRLNERRKLTTKPVAGMVRITPRGIAEIEFRDGIKVPEQRAFKRR